MSSFDAVSWALREALCLDSIFVHVQALRNDRLRSLLSTRRFDFIEIFGDFYDPSNADAENVSANCVSETLLTLRTETLRLSSFTEWSAPMLETLSEMLQKNIVRRLEFCRCSFSFEKEENALAEMLLKAVGLKTVSFSRMGIFYKHPEPFPVDLEVGHGGDDERYPTFPARSDITVASLIEADKFLSDLDPSACRLKSLTIGEQYDVDALERFLQRYHKFETLMPVPYSSSLLRCLVGNPLKCLALKGEPSGKEAEAALCNLLQQSPFLEKLGIGCLSYAVIDAVNSCRSIIRFSLSGSAKAQEELILRLFATNSTIIDLQLSMCLEHPESWDNVFRAVPMRIKSFSFFTNDEGLSPDAKLAIVPLLNRGTLWELSWSALDEYDEETEMEAIRQALLTNRTLRRFHGEFRFAYIEEDFKLQCSAMIEWGGYRSHFVNHRNKCCSGRAKRAAIALMALKKFRNIAPLRLLLKDLVSLVANQVWETRWDSKTWWNDDDEENEIHE